MILELKGFQSLRAFNTYSSLVLGLKMIPEYLSVSYEDFLELIDAMDDDDRRDVFKKSLSFVQLEEQEVQSLIGFCLDANGVPYSKASIKNLGPDELINLMAEVCLEISRIKLDQLSEDQKKKLKSSASMFGDSSSGTQTSVLKRH